MLQQVPHPGSIVANNDEGQTRFGSAPATCCKWGWGDTFPCSPDKDIRMGLSKSKQYCDPLLPASMYVIDCQRLNTAWTTPSNGVGALDRLSRKNPMTLIHIMLST